MSAFMVSHETIDVVLSFALYGAPGDHGLRWYGETDDGTAVLTLSALICSAVAR